MTTEPHSSWKIGLYVALPLIIALIVLGCLISPSKEDGYFTSAILIGCMAIGWTIGMALSPDTKTEEKKFLKIWKGTSLFASGYLISKIDPLVNELLSPTSILHTSDHLLPFRLTAGISTIILSSIVVYVVRVYCFTVGE